ncbi:unnamed protein product [Clavelina lepadiformis]|uniref:Uncharacterized protein n=1 Tax=Clavelina lepadiformis TaxID=159417 RepID=A0ABP0F1F9_CLALP
MRSCVPALLFVVVFLSYIGTLPNVSGGTLRCPQSFCYMKSPGVFLYNCNKLSATTKDFCMFCQSPKGRKYCPSGGSYWNGK